MRNDMISSKMLGATVGDYKGEFPEEYITNKYVNEINKVIKDKKFVSRLVVRVSEVEKIERVLFDKIKYFHDNKHNMSDFDKKVFNEFLDRATHVYSNYQVNI